VTFRLNGRNREYGEKKEGGYPPSFLTWQRARSSRLWKRQQLKRSASRRMLAALKTIRAWRI
jgi:hypothetical protein